MAYRPRKFNGKGRPPKPIDWDLVDKYLAAGCTATEIAPHFNMNAEVFGERVRAEHGVTFTEYAGEKCALGDANLKAAQYYKAIGASKRGDTTLLIHLGKCRLGQQPDKIDIVVGEAAIKAKDDLFKQLEETQKKLFPDKKEEEVMPSEEKVDNV